MTTAAFIWPDTHLIVLAGEVAFTEGWGEKYRPYYSIGVHNEPYDILPNVSSKCGTYVSDIQFLAAPIHCSTLVLMIWGEKVQNERGEDEALD